MAQQVKQVPVRETNTQLSGKGGAGFKIHTRTGGNPTSGGKISKSGKK